MEIFAYVWHRHIAHKDIILNIHDIHKIHHEINLNVHDEAEGDFIWLLLIMIIAELLAGFIVISNIFSDTIILVTIIIGIVTFWWNNYIHSAYHQENHWLNSYDWFKKDKELHYLHHKYPNKNYGIASHFSDILFGSYINT